MQINGKTYEFPGEKSVCEVLETNSLLTPESLVLLNGDVVEQAEYDQVIVKENDSLEVLRFVGGG